MHGLDTVLLGFLRGLYRGDTVGFRLLGIHGKSTVRFRLRNRSRYRRIHGNRSLRHDIEKFHLEYQKRVPRNYGSSAVRAIAQIARNPRFDLFTDLHKRQQFLPTLDHSIHRKFQRFATLDGTVKFRPVKKGSRIMDANLVREFRGLRCRIRRLDDVFILKTARSRDNAFRRLVLFQENLLGIQSGLCRSGGLLFAFHLHLENKFLQSLVRLGIGKKKRVPFHLVAKGLQEKLLINVRIDVLDGASHIHAERIAVTVLRRDQRILFRKGDCRRILRWSFCGGGFRLRSARTGD